MLSNEIITFKGVPLFQKAKFKSPYLMQGEIHDFACFFYMTKGRMESTSAAGKQMLNHKEAVLKSCGNYIQRYISDDGTGECEAIAVYLYPNLLKEIYKNDLPAVLEKTRASKSKAKLIGNKLIEQYMSNLAIYFQSPEAFDEELGILKIKELVLILLKSERYESIPQLLSEVLTPIDVKFTQTIENNIFNNLSLEQLAFITGKSVSTFKRLFKKHFDESPARYIKKRRLTHAAQLLLCSNDPVSSIAYDSGFQDVTTFSANFLEHFKLSPSKYRLHQNRKSLN